MFAKRWACRTTDARCIQHSALNILMSAPASLAASPHSAVDQPSRWVQRFAQLIPAGGLTLDLACGAGRHARHLAALGHQVLAVDRDAAMLALASSDAHGIRTLAFDLEAEGSAAMPDWPLQQGRYSGIVVTNYLHRPLMADLLASLTPGGVLIYETFAEGNSLFGKPSNPAFLLTPGELLAWVSTDPDMRVLAFEDGYVESPKPAMVQRICAIRHTDRLSPQARSIERR